jgi:excisionase family DNA binding protein
METDRLLNVEQAAEVLNISTDFLYRHQRYKTLPFTIILRPRRIRFSLKGMLRWLEEQQHGRTGIQAERDVSHSV